MIAILAHEPKPLRKYNPDIPAPLADMIHRLLSREPRDRPQSAEVLARELSRVADECHAKSEVALALNKLQAGLNEVVGKSQDSSGIDVLSAAAAATPVADPFASIPDSVLATPAESSGSIPAMAAHANPYAKPAAPKPAPKKSGFNWQTHWPIVGFAAAALVAIPIVLYAWLYLGSDTSTVVVMDAASDRSANVNASTSLTDNAGGSAPNAPAPNGGATNGQRGNNAASNRSSGQKAGGNRQQYITRTGIGRGADTTLGPTLSEPQGTLQSLSLRDGSQRPRDTRHAYLRFDLASMKFPREAVGWVQLSLPVQGQQKPNGTTLKVYGVTDQVPEDWEESGDNGLVWASSPSKDDLQGLTLLVESEVGSQQPLGKTVPIKGPELTAFIRQSESDLVTFVITVDGVTPKPIRIASRENSAGNVVKNRGPSLMVNKKKTQ